MKTIDKILKKYNLDQKILLELEIEKKCNWCWPKHNKFFPFIKKDKNYNPNKQEYLLYDLDFLCDIHDLQYWKGGWLFKYIKANYILAKNIYTLLHWTKWYTKLFVFILVFGGTTMFGFRYFNWK